MRRVNCKLMEKHVKDKDNKGLNIQITIILKDSCMQRNMLYCCLIQKLYINE